MEKVCDICFYTKNSPDTYYEECEYIYCSSCIEKFKLDDKCIYCNVIHKRIKETPSLYVPLQFWFNRNTDMAIPLIAMQYHDVQLNLEINDDIEHNVRLTEEVD